MNYKIVIVGHGNYPSGVLSALQLLTGGVDNVSILNLDESCTHQQFERTLRSFLLKNDRVLIFADMTGGAPYQIAGRLIYEVNNDKHMIISSASVNLILDLYMKLQADVNDRVELKNIITSSIEEARNMILLTSVEYQEENNSEFGEGI